MNARVHPIIPVITCIYPIELTNIFGNPSLDIYQRDIVKRIEDFTNTPKRERGYFFHLYVKYPSILFPTIMNGIIYGRKLDIPPDMYPRRRVEREGNRYISVDFLKPYLSVENMIKKFIILPCTI